MKQLSTKLQSTLKVSQSKHGFLRGIVLLCLVMMVALTATVIVMAAVTGTQLDAGVLGVLMGGWCGELLLTLLKRRWDAGETEDTETE